MDTKPAADLALRPLTPTAAAMLAVLYTLLLVVPFYIAPATRPSPTLSRDHPSVIRTRIGLVTLTCLTCAPISVGLLRDRAGLPWPEIWRLLGWWPVSPRDALQALLLTAVLFVGPLYERAVADGGARRWITGLPLRETMGSWIGIRNYIVGPLSEEFIYRSLLMPLYLLSALPARLLLSSPTMPSSPLTARVQATIINTVLLSPLPFSLAHLHHLHSQRLTHPQAPLIVLLLGSLLQFSYTALFGWFAGFVFVRTGSLLAVTLVHSLANWMGLPRFWGAIGTTTTTDARTVALHTMNYYVLLFGGAYAFATMLWPLTESSNGLVRGF